MTESHKSYIDTQLIPEVISKLDNEELVSYTAEHSSGLDGFMSTLYNIQLKTKSAQGEKYRFLIAKFMRGDTAFRESSKSYIQFANEIYIYAHVLPEFEKMLKDHKITSPKITDLVPPCYKAEFGFIKGLSTSLTDKEAVLVLENLKPLGFQMGPRLSLNRDHLLAMCKPLGQYHAFSYALRAVNNSQLERLKSGITVLPFINDNDPNDANNNVYRVLYRVAFDRFYEFFDRKIDTNTFDKKSEKDLKLIENVGKLREKYFEEPTRLMERFRTKVEDNEEDQKFGAILHGDYNRNNVLFKYQVEKGGGDSGKKVEEMKMFDFQEVRYGSPDLDLSFFMYFNSTEDMRADIWLELLQSYHSNMYETLETILKASDKSEKEIDDILLHYSFAKFQAHFGRFAFYGVIICLQFLPWMLCSEEECSRISELFASDLFGEKFRKLILEAGGDEVNKRLLAVVRHASEMGYMDDL